VGVTRVVVHIDRLVLRGYAHEDRHAIAASLQQELTERLSRPGAVERLGALEGGGPRIGRAAVTVRLGADTRAAGIGRAVARGIVPGGER
jgi:hypothetical protein